MRTRRRRSRSATLSDVARRAGVSATTASYILNGHSAQMRISAETESRVREAAEALSYRPNRSARSLRTATTKTLGVVLDFCTSGSTAGLMLTGAIDAARAAGHLVLVGETCGEASVEQQLIEEMLARRVDGVLFARRDTCEVTVPPALRDEDVVLLNCLDVAGALPCVVPDERGGGRTAAETLVAAGVADRVYVVGTDARPGTLAARLRLEGVATVLAEAGRAPAGVIPCDLTVASAREALQLWWTGHERPSSLVCLDDRVAMGVYQALGAYGLDVPGDVAVLSFGGSELASWLTPSLTSVAVPYALMGQLAVGRLVDRDAARITWVPMPLLEGDSLRM